MKSGNMCKDLKSHMNEKGDGPTIIYCPTKKSAEMVADVVLCKLICIQCHRLAFGNVVDKFKCDIRSHSLGYKALSIESI